MSGYLSRAFNTNSFRYILHPKHLTVFHRAIICDSCSTATGSAKFGHGQFETPELNERHSNKLNEISHCTEINRWKTTSQSHFCERNKTSTNNFLSGKKLRKEVLAVKSLFERSGFHGPEAVLRLFNGSRSFSTSPRHEQQQDDGRQNQDDPDKEEDPEDEEKMPFLARFMLTFWLCFFLFLVFRVQSADEKGTFKYISWNEFYYDMLAKGEVEELMVRPEQEVVFIKLHPGAVVKNKQVAEVFTLKIVDPYKFEEKVRKAEADLGIKPERGIPISYQRESSWVPIIFMGIVMLVLFMVFKNVKIQMPNASDMFAGERKAKFVRADLQTAQGKSVGFKDVAGLHEAKVEIMEFVDYIKNPQKYQDLGGKAPKGALLLGPPGCGKTLLAKALANEAKVPFLAMAGSEFVEMLGGLGAARVRDLFKQARQKAPCIIYVDEIDAIGRKRSGDNWAHNTEEEHTLNQLLVEMDGMSTTQGVIMLASTNRADVLDKALLRPGRFDRHVVIDFPTLAERKETFDMYLRQLKLAKLPANYSERLSQLSPGMSGADIANICNEAALHAAREKNQSIGADDFEYAVERVVAGVAKKSGVLSVKEKKVVAYHEAGHALVGWLLEHTDALLRVSIIPRTSSALGFAQYLPSDRKLYSKEELFERMCMALGGRVAESVIFNSVTSGAQDDLDKVTKMAYSQIRLLGMNDRVGQVAFPPPGEEGEVGTRPYSKYLSSVIDQEARLMVARAYQTTEQLLKENKEKLHVIAEALLEKEALVYKDVEQLIGPPSYGKSGTVTGLHPPLTAPPTVH